MTQYINYLFTWFLLPVIGNHSDSVRVGKTKCIPVFFLFLLRIFSMLCFSRNRWYRLAYAASKTPRHFLQKFLPQNVGSFIHLNSRKLQWRSFKYEKQLELLLTNKTLLLNEINFCTEDSVKFLSMWKTLFWGLFRANLFHKANARPCSIYNT